jgi:hypothetical protein
VEDWARGLSAKEVYEQARQMRAALAQQQYQQTPSQPAPQGALSYQQPLTAPPLPDAYADENQRASWAQNYANYVQTQADQRMQQTLQSYAQPLLQSNAQLARHASATDPKYADVWNRWSHEIDIQMQNVPAEMRTKQTYDLVAKHVRSEHVDELAQERAQKLMQQQGFGTERTGSGGAPPSTPSASPLDELFAKQDHPWVQKARETQMGVREIRNSLPAMGYTEQQFVDSILKDQAFGGNS